MIFLIGVSTLTVLFVLSLRFRKQVAAFLMRSGLPRWVLYFLSSIPLIIVEEQIDCQKTWCYQVLIPPTLLPLLIFMLLLFIGAKAFHAKSVVKPIVIFSVLGIAFERFFGGLVGVPLSPIIVLFLIPYVGMGYAFISLIPLTVLLE
ncbi:MAG TPA: hypothetical protein VMT99_01480 [Candidatus Paceibacterota bacterium]|nr:hypothetical protein [Candidatus Paceibacterota bacterium]